MKLIAGQLVISSTGSSLTVTRDKLSAEGMRCISVNKSPRVEGFSSKSEQAHMDKASPNSPAADKSRG